MDKTKIKKAMELAKSSIYDGVQHLGKWNGYEVFDPIFDDDEPRFIGLPQFILEKDNKFRWSQGDEWQEIMEQFYPPTGEEEE